MQSGVKYPNHGMKIAPVIFSGHNDRAVVALCRFLSAVGRPFFLIASHKNDAIFQTDWHHNVLLQRRSPMLSDELMCEVANAVRGKGYVPALCPTSEFLNRFVLEHRQVMVSQDWHYLLPANDVYLALSDKSRSPSIIYGLIGLLSPATQTVGHWFAPCVLKPNVNVVDGKMSYPKLCRTSTELHHVLAGLQSEDWFAQAWVEGQSFYLCAYLDQFGGWNAFWQENLLQQPDGKSIVLARTCANPGVDVAILMNGLHRLGYHGPFMMEIIRDGTGQLHFIEINPRFWGPLDLARRACPVLMERFLSDMDKRQMHSSECISSTDFYYSWAFGARQGQYRVYPAAATPVMRQRLHKLLQEHDVYGFLDTHALFNQY